MANAKKRRRGVSKIRLTKANRSKFIKKTPANPVIKEHWDSVASASQNLASVGIAEDPNKAVAGGGAEKQPQPPVQRGKKGKGKTTPALAVPVEEIFGAFRLCVVWRGMRVGGIDYEIARRRAPWPCISSIHLPRSITTHAYITQACPLPRSWGGIRGGASCRRRTRNTS